MINEQANVEVRVNDQQALKRIEELTKKLDTLGDARNKALTEGDIDKWRKLSKEFDNANTELKRLDTYTKNVDRAIRSVSTATPKELRDTIKAINRELNSGRIARGSKEWDMYQQKLKQVKAELKSIQDLSNVNPKPNLWDRTIDFTSRFLGAYTMAKDAIESARSWLNQRVNAYAQMEEAEAQVRKYTGMTKEQVKDLNEELKKIDTRTSREQLNALAGDAGRLGITSKEAILEFVDAADKIKVALGDDLGESAVRDIGKLAQMFGEDRTKGLRGAMLATGSAVNELAQNSSASADYLVNFTSRLAGVAQQAGISQANIMGFASALDQNMQQVETSATVFSQLITKFFQKPEKFARLAGMAVEDFSNLLKTDANEALLQFLRTMQSKGGFDSLAPMFEEMKLNGSRAVGVLSSVASHLDQVTTAQKLANQAYEEGTSIGIEFGVQNTTVQAQLDKARKAANELAVALGERLLPVVTEGLHMNSKVSKALIVVADFTAKHIGIIATLAATIATLTVAVKLHTLATKAYTIATEAAAVATRVFNAVAKAGPWGWAAAGLAAVVTALVAFRNKTDKAVEGQAELNARLAEYETLLGRINAAHDKTQFVEDIEKEIEATKKLIAERKKANKEWYDEKHGHAVAFSYGHDRIKAIDDEYNQRQAVVTQLQEHLQELVKKQYSLSNTKPTQTIDNFTPTIPVTEETDKERKSRLQAAVSAAKAQADAEEAVLMAKYRQGQIDYKEYTAAIAQLQIDLQSKLLTIYDEGTSEYSAALKQRESLLMKQLEDERKAVADTEKQRIDGELRWIDEQERLNSQQLQDQYTHGRLSTEAYNQARFEAEIQFLQQRQSLYTRDSEEFKKLQTQIDDKINADRLSKYQEYQQQLEQLREQYQQKSASEMMTEEISQLDALHNYGLISEEEYQQLRSEIIKRYEQENFQNSLQTAQMLYSQLSSITSAYSSYLSAASEVETAAIEDKYDKEIERAGSNTAKAKKLEEKKQKDIAAVKNKYNKKAMAIEVAQALASTAMAAVNAYASAAKIPVTGFVIAPIAAAAAVAAGMLQVAAIQKQHQAQQSGYYTGGFTGTGDTRKEAGVVHRGEFVANHEAVANPNLLPILRLIDYAQRNNSVGSLTAADVSRAINPVQTVATVVSPAPATDSGSEALAVMVAAAERMHQTVDRLTQTLDEGIESYVTIDGPRGFDRQYRHWQRLQGNK